MTIEVRFSASVTSQTNKYRCDISEALDCYPERVNAMIHVHTVFECIIRETVWDTGVLSGLVPGKHTYHVLMKLCQYSNANL
jgi:hypothetical protein